ncbi:MAG TPA: DUF1156 domain-containing protein [bacterium]|nr:DUF1156 domain-containing protein [bacterium]HQL63998.1 DUF1156 domain-containing protein [bacterium]
MIPKECKRLAEVDFPIAEVSKHSAREKSIRHGHPSTLHLWWARRPLAACRAMLLALLLPDPCDDSCPDEFRKEARDLLCRIHGQIGQKDIDLRKALLEFIGRFSNWDLSNDPTYLEVSRGLVKAAHPEETPLVVDPFAGGGSIPLEALRLGCETFASDLNPVACLILKVMLEDIPRHGPELANELRRVGREIKEKAEKELAEFYPKDPDGATPIAYLWARTVKCESPNCGAEIPLMRSFWLCKKANRKRALRPVAQASSLHKSTSKPSTPPEDHLRSGKHDRGYLPHWKSEGATYYVTFRLAGTLPKTVLDRFEQEISAERADLQRRLGRISSEKEQELRDSISHKIDEYLDTGRGDSWLKDPAISKIVADALRHFDGERYHLHAYVIMPNHVHVLVTPKGQHTLSSILHSWKSYTGNQANKVLGRTDKKFWQPESYDHLVRDERDYWRILEYIGNNPVKAGLTTEPEKWPWFWMEEGECRQDASDRSRQDACATVEFEIFEPKTDKEVPGGTVTRAKATCLCCGTVLSPDRVRAQLSEQRGGADVIFGSAGFQPATKRRQDVCATRIGGARMLAVVTLKPGEQGRHYRLPTERDYQAVWKAQKRLKQILDEWERGGKKGLCPVPDEPLPPIGTLGFRVQRYGMLQWGDLFTARQKTALVSIGGSLASQSKSVALPMACALSRLADKNASLAVWNQIRETIEHVFGRQALPIVWDFAEVAIFSGATGNYLSGVELVVNVIEGSLDSPGSYGQVQQADAIQSPLPDESSTVVFTDPPYYDAIPYADLSDFFLVWLKRTLPNQISLRDPHEPNNNLSPKTREAVQDETKSVNGRPKDRAFFEETMAKAFAEGRRILKAGGIGSIVFAHKTTEGWESLLSGMTQGGWTITASWPVATERPGRLRSQDSAALATSVHLICRPRPEDAPVGDWADVLRELPKRVGDWMERLQGEGIRGADLVFACIGPALEIYSRYSKVVDPAEREIPLGGDPTEREPHLRGYLSYVWEIVGRSALEQVLGTAEAKARNSAAGALEEDARLTALFLWTLQSTNGVSGSGSLVSGSQPATTNEEPETEYDDEEETPKKKPKGFTLIFDVVRRFAQPLGINLAKWESRVIKTEKGVVRLLPVSERAKQLFGQEQAQAIADWILEDPKRDLQQMLLPEFEADRTQRIPRRGRGKAIMDAGPVDLHVEHKATTLDRVHAAMLLQAGGQANALRMLIKSEIDRGPDFLRLANALSALYPKGSEEKRLLDAMLLAVPR